MGFQWVAKHWGTELGAKWKLRVLLLEVRAASPAQSKSPEKEWKRNWETNSWVNSSEITESFENKTKKTPVSPISAFFLIKEERVQFGWLEWGMGRWEKKNRCQWGISHVLQKMNGCARQGPAFVHGQECGRDWLGCQEEQWFGEKISHSAKPFWQSWLGASTAVAYMAQQVLCKAGGLNFAIKE